ncbi:MAG: MarC family protein [Gammaproteobacteria bacterium]|nr:MarC family protein [Gammaproteobacteria bacterium]
MDIDGILLAKLFVSLIVVLAPVDVIPLYLSLTHELDAQQRRRVLRRMIITVVITLLAFQYTGMYLFNFIGISLPSFQVAGGLILASMAWSMLHALPSRIQSTQAGGADATPREDVSVVPLGIPMLAGPGTITTVILYAQQQHGSISGHLQLSGVILLTAAALYALFSLARPLFNALGPTGVRITTRLMGMLLLAVAMEFILRGVTAVLAR